MWRSAKRWAGPRIFEAPVTVYMDRSIYSFRAIAVDASVTREKFAVTTLAPAEVAARQALFHVTMGRPVEARAAIAEARKAGGSPDADVAEGLLADTDNKADDARAALTRATDAGTTDAYAYYRLASLLWRPDADRATLERLQTLLKKCVDLNLRYAAGYDFLASINDQLGAADASGLALRAVALEPGDAHHHLTAARLLGREKRYDLALQHVQAAQELADTDALVREVTEVRTWIAQMKDRH